MITKETIDKAFDYCITEFAEFSGSEVLDILKEIKAELEQKLVKNINHDTVLAVVIDDSVKSWWNSLTTLQKLDAENKTFGTGDECEDNTLTDNDIVRMYDNR